MYRNLKSCRWALLIVLITVCSLAAPSNSARGDDALQATSLEFVPANVSFYSSSLRQREIYDRVVESRMFTKAWQSPTVQMGLQLWNLQQQDPESEIAQFMELMAQPENVELKELGLDMVSHEMFMYGDQNWAKLNAAINQMYREATQQGFEEGIRSQKEDQDKEPSADDAAEDDAAEDEDADVEPDPVPPEFDAEFNRFFAKTITDTFAEMKMPSVVVGFRLTDTQRALRQIDRLDELLRQVEELQADNMKLRGNLKIGGGTYLCFSIHGIEFPTDANEDSEVPPEVEEALRQAFKDMTFEFAVGVYGDYAVLSFGPSNDHLASLGQAPLLKDRPELAPLKQAADRPLTSISYVSKEMVEANNYGPETVDMYLEIAETMATASQNEEEWKLTPAQTKRFWADVKQVGDGMKSWFPQRGARMSYSWLTEHGFEGLAYNYDENIFFNGSSKLSLLNHVGGDPIFFWLNRRKHSEESWAPIFKMVDMSMEWSAIFLKQEAEGEELEEIIAREKLFMPHLRRLTRVVREEMFPALADDGQAAWVLDNKLAKQSWHAAMPPAAEPLPILEPAVIHGVANVKQFRKSLAKWQKISNQLEKLGRENFEEFDAAASTVSTMETKQVKHGTIYYYPFEPESQVPSELAPSYAIGQGSLLATLSPSHAERLLTPTPLRVEGVIANHKGPAFGAAYFHWGKLVDTFQPWIEYMGQLAQADDTPALSAEGDLKPNAEDESAEVESEDAQSTDDPIELIQPVPATPMLPELDPQTIAQIESWLDVLKCFQQYSSVSYVEGEAQVTHYEYRFRDLPK